MYFCPALHNTVSSLQCLLSARTDQHWSKASIQMGLCDPNIFLQHSGTFMLYRLWLPVVSHFVLPAIFSVIFSRIMLQWQINIGSNQESAPMGELRGSPQTKVHSSCLTDVFQIISGTDWVRNSCTSEVKMCYRWHDWTWQTWVLFCLTSPIFNRRYTYSSVLQNNADAIVLLGNNHSV